MTTRLAGAPSGLGDDVDQRRFAAIHDRQGVADGGTKIVGIGDRSFSVDPQTLRDLRVVDGEVP